MYFKFPKIVFLESLWRGSCRVHKQIRFLICGQAKNIWTNPVNYPVGPQTTTQVQVRIVLTLTEENKIRCSVNLYVFHLFVLFFAKPLITACPISVDIYEHMYI